mgnify:CR=1 FL=1
MRRPVATAILALTALAGGGALAQEAYPARPVRFVSCCAGIIDATARVIADHVAQSAKQAVVVETKPGASGMLGADFVARSKPDGYTVFIGTNSTHAANQSLFKQVPYDFVKDFTPVSGIAVGQILLITNLSVPVRNVAELTELARRQPGKLTFGWGSSSTRAGMELYRQLTGIDVVNVPYKTNPQATSDVMAGQITMMFADPVTATPLVKAGKVRGLAASGTKRLPELPDIPTMQEAGVPGYEMTWWVAAWTPAGTPRDVVAKLNGWIVEAIRAPKTREYFVTAGLDPYATTPEELGRFQLAEFDKWAKIVKAAGIEPQ